MKLRSTPVVDACLNLAITLPLVFLVLLIAQGWQFAVIEVTAVALLFLMPAFLLQILGGLITRRKARLNKFLMSIAVSLLLAATVVYITVDGLSAETSLKPEDILAAQQSWILVSVIYFCAQLTAATLTHFFLTVDAPLRELAE